MRNIHYFFFVFKYRFRRVAFNNFIKIKKIKNFRLFDLSGPLYFFIISKLLILFSILFPKSFKNITLISCDGLPFLKKKGVNIWFGGSDLKIPLKFRNYRNNLPIIRNPCSKKNFNINLYPCFIKKSSFNKKFKIVFIGKLISSNIPKIKLIWKKNSSVILSNPYIIENINFLKKFEPANIDEMIQIYQGLKSEIRLNFLLNIKKKFKEDLIIVGNDFKKFIPESLDDNSDVNFVRSLYKNNLCLDFGSKWGNNCLYPRSVEIIESSGLLLQSQQADSKIIFGKFCKFLTFNSYDNLLKIILSYKKNYNLLNLNQKKVLNLFSKNYKNYNTLSFFKKISQK